MATMLIGDVFILAGGVLLGWALRGYVNRRATPEGSAGG